MTDLRTDVPVICPLVIYATITGVIVTVENEFHKQLYVRRSQYSLRMFAVIVFRRIGELWTAQSVVEVHHNPVLRHAAGALQGFEKNSHRLQHMYAALKGSDDAGPPVPARIGLTRHNTKILLHDPPRLSVRCKMHFHGAFL